MPWHKRSLLALAASVCFLSSVYAEAPPAELRPVAVATDGVYGLEFRAGQQVVGKSSTLAPAGVSLRLPGEGGFKLVAFRNHVESKNTIVLGPVVHGNLTLRLHIERLHPSLVKQTLEVSAAKPQKFAASFAFFPTLEGQYASFTQSETARVVYDTLGGGPEYPGIKGQTFPVAMIHGGGLVFGIVADSPALWENRCLVLIDPRDKQLAVLTGDGRDPYPLSIKHDATNQYQYQMDGWQSLAGGETRRYTTWLFAAQAKSHYDAQVAAHLALANGKGWNHSALEAILRNTAYLLLRRNLMRSEGRFIFTSGIGYGWKQWVTDGFYQAIALDDPEKLIESYRSVFINRITYEDNAQYYLMWAVLAKRAGGVPNAGLVKQAYEFIRKHEKDGIYYPPPMTNTAVKNGFKTYMDLLPYADDDPPTSNQGFHCGALLAARELGFPVNDRDLNRAIAGYQRMYNAKLRFMPTSLKQQDIMGQDTLYGAALTYALFGRKILSDEQVQGHLETTLKVQSRYGMRVISKADGSLLPGHSGSYVFGGSWFLCDAANYLVAGLHGTSAEKVDGYLIARIEKELAHVPAFHESISTLDGKPHGHILYSWNSGYWWLRKEFRRRLGQKGSDPVDVAIDRKLGVVRDDAGWLRLGSK